MIWVKSSPVMGEFFFTSASSVQRLRQAQHDNFSFFDFFSSFSFFWFFSFFDSFSFLF